VTVGKAPEIISRYRPKKTGAVDSGRRKTTMTTCREVDRRNPDVCGQDIKGQMMITEDRQMENTRGSRIRSLLTTVSQQKDNYAVDLFHIVLGGIIFIRGTVLPQTSSWLWHLRRC